MEMATVNGDNISIELNHIVFIVKIDGDIIYFTIKTPEFLDETHRRKDKKTLGAEEHKRGHSEMYGKEEEGGKQIFANAMFQPSEAQRFREKDMLEVTHIACRKEKDIIIEPEEVVFFDFEWFITGNFFQYLIDRRDTVNLGNNIERSGRVEDKSGR